MAASTVPGEAAVGQTIVMDETLAMTLVSAEFLDEVPGLSPSGAGRTLLLVEVELERRGSGPVAFNERRLTLKHGRDNDRGAYPRLEAGIRRLLPDDRAFGSGTLKKGERRHGFVAFNVSNSERTLSLDSGHVGGSWSITGPAALPESVPAEQCRTVSRVSKSAPWPTGSPGTGYPTPPSDSNNRTRYEFTSDTPTVVLGVAKTINMAVACINAGDRERLTGLVTDDFLRRFPGIVSDPAAPALPGRTLAI